MEIECKVRKRIHLAIYSAHLSLPLFPEKKSGFWEQIWWLLRRTWDDFHSTVIHEHLDANEVGGVLNKDEVTGREEEMCDHVETLGGTGCCNQVIAEDEGTEETKEIGKTRLWFRNATTSIITHESHAHSILVSNPDPPFLFEGGLGSRLIPHRKTSIYGYAITKEYGGEAGISCDIKVGRGVGLY